MTLAILGGGAWGTALALAAERAGTDVLLWARNPGELLSNRASPRLPGITLSEAIHVTGDLAEAAAAELLLMVVPAQETRGLLMRLPDGTAPIILCAKGLERASGALPIEVAAEAAPGRAIGLLSGPNFAAEVASGQPTAAVIASTDAAVAEFALARLFSPRFRCYASSDPIGVSACGAVKNVLAIACGIAAGRGLGDNARAALITRGLAELARFSVALGGRPETVAGLAGLGDLVLTCTPGPSRNFGYGLALGRGESPPARLAEGVFTAAPVAARARALGIEMPIAEAVDAVVNRGSPIDREIAGLLDRPVQHEAATWPTGS